MVLISCSGCISYNCKLVSLTLGGGCVYLTNRTTFNPTRRVGGMEGHVSRDCSMEAKAKSCYKCGLEGHIVRCPASLFYISLIRLTPSSPVIALKTVVATVADSDLLARNVTVAERLAISLVHVLRVPAAMLATVEVVLAVTAAERLATPAAV
ncbi:hypothetical protein EDD16DRAFT_560540 [Pisolithus croceorrhizus]|nr:hypothetical protein EDD16DRAFT_560540 [Pisolithus croceorrhizus]